MQARAIKRPYGGWRRDRVGVVERICDLGLQTVAKDVDGALGDQPQEARRLGPGVFDHGREHALVGGPLQQHTRRVELGDAAVVQHQHAVRVLGMPSTKEKGTTGEDVNTGSGDAGRQHGSRGGRAHLTARLKQL